MSSFLWPAEDGWPYPDPAGDMVDVESDMDDDLLSIVTDTHLFDGLDALEREVLCARFGLRGHLVQSIDQLHDELGLPLADIEVALGSGLEKVRVHLTA
ncbi:MAG TPA: hypothetical protein VHN98_04530 [Acidimicrobiales bacterium]|nr:hypothetical protein [Acidimicrobiales bacterium]